MGGTAEHGEREERAAHLEPPSAMVPLLQQPAVWIDPPDELGDEVVDSVRAELP
jgi:hypothetical protein